jgi:hypothetical protein
MNGRLASVDNDSAERTEAGRDMALSRDRAVFLQTDDEPVNASGKVIKVLLDPIQNESFTTLIAVHHVVMHENLHGLSFSTQRQEGDWADRCISPPRRQFSWRRCAMVCLFGMAPVRRTDSVRKNLAGLVVESSSGVTT